MDYSQFMNLMNEQQAGKDSVPLLQEYVSEFPYFQTAQILLARAMHEQQHVRFEKQLKLASAYSGDRKVLFNLIHPKPSTLFGDKVYVSDSPFINELPVEPEVSENIFVEEETLIPPVPVKKEEVAVETIAYTPVPPFYAEETEIPDTESDIDDGPMVADPHEIIRKRLNEILGLKEKSGEFKPIQEKIIPSTNANVENDAPKPVDENVAVELEQKNIPEQKDSKDFIDKIAEESAKAVDVIDKGELEYALEASLIQSLEKLPLLPVTAKETSKEVEEVKFGDTFSFFNWLKQKKIKEFGIFEEVHAEDKESEQENEEIAEKPEEISNRDASELIDRFILTDPKIVPSRVEFYSPSSQAKKSITESEDLVSETLAGIYKLQGNLLKARSCYQKLSLLFPEKKTYFAALISEVDKEINNQNKQDL